MRMGDEGRAVDVHCHILPGIDDGARDWEQSCRMLDIAWQQGVHTVIATPHYMPGRRNAAPETVRRLAERLQDYAQRKGYQMKIYTGNEIYYHDDAAELLNEGKILTMADSDCVLVEFSPMEDFRYIRNALADLQAEGYTPLLAHVERYASVCQKPFDRIEELRDMGVLIQVNAATVERKMGWKMQRLVTAMLKRGLVDFIGTDAHSAGHRAPVLEKCRKILYRKCPAGYVDALLYGNAEKYIFQNN